MRVGDTVCGFTLRRRRENAEIKGTLWEFTHEKSGASLCWVDNQAENKLFSVAFKTVPDDDSGVFHILEHSVLNGSKKYPVKEPFVELLKSSMNTFLNAMTYPDKTVYPVSSRNEKDFLNLVSVYLDAVWCPRLLDDKNIFLQEGRRFETGEEPSFNGVVLNEMKGAMSEVDSLIESRLDKLLFPDTCYRYNSGGEPDSIIKLTYERFCESYRKFYHPSNALFYLDGDLPLEKTLTLIDGYLKDYGKKTDLPEIPAQEPCPGEATAYFDPGAEDGKACVAFGKILGKYSDCERMAAASVLCDLLTFSNDAPLKKAILSEGLADDIELFVSDGIYQPYLATVLRNAGDADTGKIRETIQKTVRNLTENGIPVADLTASINRLEFTVRQLPEPQGLYRMSAVYDSWLYGGDPMLFLDRSPIFAALRSKIETGGYEQLLAEMFDWQNTAVLRLLPEKGLAEREKQKEKRYAAEIYGGLSDAEKATLTAETAGLRRWQETPDSEEDLLKLPRLTIDDVSKTPPRYITEESECGGCRILYHPADCNGIIYFTVYAPLTGFSLEELSMLSVLTELYTELPVHGRDLADLQREIKTYLGELTFDITVNAPLHETESCTPFFTVSAAALSENLIRAESLAAEIMLNTDISDREKTRQIVLQIDEKNRRDAVASGNALAVSVVRASFSAAGAARDAVSGFAYVRAVREFAGHFDEYFNRLTELKKRLEKNFLCRGNVIIGVTADKPVALDTAVNALPRGRAAAGTSVFVSPYPEKTGIRVPAAVSFAVKGVKDPGGKITSAGGVQVLANLVTYSYLWTKIRVLGGAYGSGFTVVPDEGFLCYSYRDPSPAASLDVYGKTSRFVKSFVRGGESLEPYIISAVSGAEPLMTPWQYGSVADRYRFRGIDDGMLAKIRGEMLSATKQTLLEYLPLLEKMADGGTVCVVAGDALNDCPGLTVFEL